MGNWYLKNLGDAMLVADDLEQVEAVFSSAYAARGSPAAVAAFMRHESDGRLHCEVKLYFSPASADIVQHLGVVRCRRPSPDGLALLVGSEAVWSLLFPD